MAQLTWREMSAPDFSTASRNYGEFGRMFSDGLGGIRSAVNGFDQARSDEVNNQLAVALASAKDAAAAREMIASGQVGGINIRDSGISRRLNPTTLAAISPASMAALQTSQVAAEEAKINQTQRAALDAQAPALAAAAAAGRVGNSAEVERILGGLNYTGVGAGAVNNLNTNTQNTARTQVSTDTSRFSLTTDQEAYANATAVADMISQLRANTMNADDARTWINNPDGPLAKQNPRVRAAVEAEVQSMYPGVFGTPGEGAAAIAGAVGAGGGAPSGPVAPGSAWSTVFGNGKYGSADVANMSMGDVVTFGEQVLIPRTKAAGFGKTADGRVIGTSASGAFQITKSTLEDYAPKLFGPNWRSMQFSPANQELIAKQIFEDSKNGNLKAKWEGLPDARPGAYKNMTWEQVKPLIFRHELGERSASQLLLDNVAAERQLAVRSSQDNSHGLNIDFATTMNDTRNPGQIAADLTGENGVFRGTSRGFLVDQINRIMREGNVNAATAGAVLQRNIAGSKEAPWWDVPGNVRNTYSRLTGGTPALGGGISINDRGVAADIALLSQMGAAGIQQQMSAQDARTVDRGQLAAARATFQSAQAQLAQARMRIANGQRGLVAMLPRYEAQVAAAEQQMVMLEALAAQPANRPR